MGKNDAPAARPTTRSQDTQATEDAAAVATTATATVSDAVQRQNKPLFYENKTFPIPHMNGLVFTIQELQEEDLAPQELWDALIAHIPHYRMFASEARVYSTFYMKLAKFLEDRQILLPVEYKKADRYAEGISKAIYKRPLPHWFTGHSSEDGDLSAPTAQIINDVPLRTDKPDTMATIQAGQPTDNHEGNNAAKIANSIASRFREKEKRFAGTILENLQEFFDDYLSVCDINDVKSSKDHLKYLPIALEGDAKRFFHDKKSANPLLTFNQMRLLFNKEYNSKTNQKRIYEYLSNLDFESHIATSGDASAALNKIYQKIQRLSPQLPLQYRGEWHKVELLSKVVKGYPWSRIPRNTLDNSEEQSFNHFYQNLLGELQLEKHYSQGKPAADIKNDIFFVGQRRYGKPQPIVPSRKFNGKPAGPSTKSSGQPAAQSINCWNCGGNHFSRNCPENVNQEKLNRIMYQVLENAQIVGDTENHVDSGNGAGNPADNEPVAEEEVVDLEEEILYIQDEQFLNQAFDNDTIMDRIFD